MRLWTSWIRSSRTIVDVLAVGLLWNGKVEDTVVYRRGDVVVVDLGVDEVVERGSSCCGLD
jgi:hypothetical protein